MFIDSIPQINYKLFELFYFSSTLFISFTLFPAFFATLNIFINLNKKKDKLDYVIYLYKIRNIYINRMRQTF